MSKFKSGKKPDYRKLKIHDPALCGFCGRGSCCRLGVQTDLFEVARILELSLDIPKPWFDFLGRDRRFPSGFKFATVLKKGRCVFQADNMRCRVYKIRPRFCVEFPLEDGRKAPDYRILCHHVKSKAKKRNND